MRYSTAGKILPSELLGEEGFLPSITNISAILQLHFQDSRSAPNPIVSNGATLTHSYPATGNKVFPPSPLPTLPPSNTNLFFLSLALSIFPSRHPFNRARCYCSTPVRHSPRRGEDRRDRRSYSSHDLLFACLCPRKPVCRGLFLEGPLRACWDWVCYHSIDMTWVVGRAGRSMKSFCAIAVSEMGAYCSVCIPSLQ